MKTKFIFSYIDRDENGIYKDMTSDKADGIIEYLPSHKIMGCSILQKLEKALLSKYLQNTPFCSFFQCIFGNLDNYHYELDTNYFILIPSTSVSKLSIKYLQRFLSKHPNVKLFPILTDSMHASSPHMEYVRSKLRSNVWEKILTFDKNDAVEYGFTWFGYSWYSKFEDIEPSATKTNLFYVGFKKGNREKILADIYEQAILRKIACDFKVVANTSSIIEVGKKLRYTVQRFSYPELISLIKSSNCILEVLQEGQDTQTIKYYEAVCYNKKLLTNNKHLSELPYYDSKKMRYFKGIDDIDWDWVMDTTPIKYDYHTEFSPLRIIDFLKKLYNV